MSEFGDVSTNRLAFLLNLIEVNVLSAANLHINAEGALKL
jgi:hypothetical protein